jgi:hypothetical protein
MAVLAALRLFGDILEHVCEMWLEVLDPAGRVGVEAAEARRVPLG